MGELTNKLAGLTGGKKRQWLRANRELVSLFYNEFGEQATKEEFHLTHDTLDRLLKFGPKPLRIRNRPRE